MSMNIADKIGVYLLLSLVFTLLGGIAGQVLPGTEATETIIVSFAIIGLVALIGANADIWIAGMNIISDVSHKQHVFHFTDLYQLSKLTIYSTIYCSLYPIIGSCVYDDNGTIYAEATEFMLIGYDGLCTVYCYVVTGFILVTCVAMLIRKREE